MIPWKEIKEITDEEVTAMNRKLAKQVLTKFVLIHTCKWIAIIGIARLARKLTKPQPSN